LKPSTLNSVIIIGFVAIIGILGAQLFWTRQAYDLEEKKFTQKAHIALLHVAQKLYRGTNTSLPSGNPVVKVSNDYYIVNVDNDIKPDILEYYLKDEFEKSGVHTDFEYAIYNCQSDEMVYGNYISYSDKSKKESSLYFPKNKKLVYYFAIRFPKEKSYLFSSLRFWFVLSFALLIILLVYAYSIVTIFQQKKYSELQRDFINNMTHEFKTPLSSILIASNYLRNQPNLAGDKKLLKYADIIINQANKLNSHIGEILNIAKWDSAPLSMDAQPLSPKDIIEDVAENISLQHPTLKVTIDVPETATINADIFHFTNIVYNLIDNSVKYCEKKPEVLIRFLKEKNGTLIEFSDNGIGIPNKNLSEIFDKFYRVPNPKSKEINGFGLGLHYVKKICLLHHWKIQARNNAEAGITITILIPIQHAR
jgi:two-component system phosphate regulon sensor histidine kinase PhoR